MFSWQWQLCLMLICQSESTGASSWMQVFQLAQSLYLITGVKGLKVFYFYAFQNISHVLYGDNEFHTMLSMRK